ncbi:MAG: isoprenylcysteine carboxylmethyltransferase family protein [Balneolaceae bacterium]|nr:MAG: isoprenylcysteine carboxylmethyltransferase family protein [Balneolaceae bacterium]
MVNKVLARTTFWASFAFYGLIALEFFYMFSPFAAYLYGVYGTGLNLLAFSENTSWLIAFFMPHIARETRSFLITWHEAIGMFIFAGGLIAFFIGAFQIYRNKVKKQGAVFGGIYRQIRHPQYLALMISSFGMVLIWPRYLVLFGFITVCFAYYYLARLEEKICSEKFPGYHDYRKDTGMFLPRSIEKLFKKLPQPKVRFTKISASLAFYLLLLALSFIIARGIHSYSVQSLYTHSAGNEIYVSVGKLSDVEFLEFIEITQSDSEVTSRLSLHSTPDVRFINYVMPAGLLISEVPMYIPEGRTPSHESPRIHDQTRFKIIYTLADFGPREPANGTGILREAIHKTPILEVWIDRTSRQVERILDPPAVDIYDGIPVPVF